MDSVTQFALGAAIGTVALAPRIGARRAILAGGVLGTLPDLDVFLPATGPIDAFVNHRGFSHSLFMLTALSPLLAEGLRRLDFRLRESRLACYLGVWLILVTHVLLDAFTTYGTRIFWPLSDVPVSLSSIFIIDPLYTLPLLAAVLAGLIAGGWGPGLRRTAVAGLALSTAYLGWGLAAQGIAEAKVKQALAAAGQSYERLTLIPMPFTTLLWRGLAIDGDRYVNVYRSVFDSESAAPLHVHPRGQALEAELPDRAPVEKVATFSRGYYALAAAGSDVLLTDLRMGVEPNYVFTFKIAERNSPITGMVPAEQLERVNDAAQLSWLWRRIFDESALRTE
jgi:inner membrane protein